MKTSIKAVYRGGVFQPTEPVDMPDDQAVVLEATWNRSPESSSLLGADLEEFIGTIGPWPEDPVAWQRELRDDRME